jgi:hypothetical protein
MPASLVGLPAVLVYHQHCNIDIGGSQCFLANLEALRDLKQAGVIPLSRLRFKRRKIGRCLARNAQPISDKASDILIGVVSVGGHDLVKRPLNQVVARDAKCRCFGIKLIEFFLCK